MLNVHVASIMALKPLLSLATVIMTLISFNSLEVSPKVIYSAVQVLFADYSCTYRVHSIGIKRYPMKLLALINAYLGRGCMPCTPPPPTK